MRLLGTLTITTMVTLLAIGTSAVAQECRKCIKDKLDGAGEKTVAVSALGALGGLAAGSLPGAVCGAVLGAVGSGLDTLIGVAQCDKICAKEASDKKDPQQSKCAELMTEVKN